jgi:acetolactate synthase-1/2/3 large subunit
MAAADVQDRRQLYVRNAVSVSGTNGVVSGREGEVPQSHTQRSLGPRGVAVAELLLRTLAVHGINRLWFCSGSELVPIQEAAVRLRERGAPTPEIAPVTHEHVAIAAAMGESMISGRPAAVVAHADLGPLNFGAELHTALRGGYPLLLISGYPATNPERRTSQAFWNQQRWDQGAIFRQYTKWDYKVAPYEEVGTVIARALQVALTPPQGPVYLVFPAEVLAQDHVLGDVVTADELGVGQHGGGEAEAVRALARRILDAEHPLLITERVGRDPAAVAELAALCEEFGVAARTTRYRMSLPSDHPAQLGAPDVTAADVVIVVDHHVPWIPAHGGPPADACVSVVGRRRDPAARVPRPPAAFRRRRAVPARPARGAHPGRVGGRPGAGAPPLAGVAGHRGHGEPGAGAAAP